MALTPGEEQALIMSKLSDSSITPDASQAFRDRVMNGPTPDDQSSFNGLGPTLQGAAMAGPGAPGALLAGLGAYGLARNNGGGPPRSPVSFQRDPRPEDQTLQPMSTPAVDVQPAPTLDAKYGQAGAIGAGGGAGAAGGVSGPFAAWQKAQDRQLSAIDEEKMLAGDLGASKAGRIQAVGDLQERAAAKMQRDAEDQQKVDEAAHAKMSAFLDRNAEMADQIGRAKIDPGRLMRNSDAGQMFSMGIGAAMGGMLAGLNGGPNQFMAHVDRMIDRDIKAQEGDIDNQKSALASRQSIFGQMLSETGDRRLASMQTRNLMYEAAKTKLQADSDRLGIPEVRAQSMLAINAIDQKQAAMNEDMKKHAWQLAQQQAAAGVAAQRAAEERAWQRQKDIFEMGYKTDELQVKRDEIGAKRSAAPLTEAQKAQQERDANIKAVDYGISNIGKITAGTSLDSAVSHLPSFVPGVTGSTNRTNTRKDYNIQAMMAVGAAYKLGTDSTEPKRMELLEHYSEPYVINPSDNEAVALQKMNALKLLINQNAEAKGPTAPNTSMPASFRPNK